MNVRHMTPTDLQRRDALALDAMRILLADMAPGMQPLRSGDADAVLRGVARRAYFLADAMLEARGTSL